MNLITIIKCNQGWISSLKKLDDGRLAAADEYSNLIIYNKQTFNPDIIIENKLAGFEDFIQLKNKNIACSFYSNKTIKIIKIKNNNYEDIQMIKNAHNRNITKLIELKNENLITFSSDGSFKIWKINRSFKIWKSNNNYKYEKIFEVKETNRLSDGLEIKDNEIILYTIYPQSLVFYDLNLKKKLKL